MKINVADIYENNIIKKFGNKSFRSTGEFSPKEELMWSFTLRLLKDTYPKKVFDTETDRAFLSAHLSLFFLEDHGLIFTLEDWENYLLSK